MDKGFDKVKMKRALIVTSVASMVDQFSRNNIHLLQQLGYEVDVACNFDMPGTIPVERCAKLKKELIASNVCIHQIDFSRKLQNFPAHIKAFLQIRQLLKKNNFEILHCHAPISGIIVRLVAGKLRRKKKLYVIYTAHGFHFYKGAPLKNWLIYYPVEKICSRLTDVLITINHEDYEFAKRKMKAKRIEYIPGVGIDVDRFKNAVVNREEKRKELRVPSDAFLLISVGELNKNKNHEIVIRTLAKLNNPDIHYMIAGTGPLRESLSALAERLHIEKQVHLLGFRNDVEMLYKISDCNVFPSIREGLGLAALEGMAAGLPLICSDNRGTREYAENGVNAIVCREPSDYEEAIVQLVRSRAYALELGRNGRKKSYDFSCDRMNDEMLRFYNIETMEKI